MKIAKHSTSREEGKRLAWTPHLACKNPRKIPYNAWTFTYMISFFLSFFYFGGVELLLGVRALK